MRYTSIALALLLIACSDVEKPADLHLVVEEVDFGLVEMNGSAFRAVALSNRGTLPATVRGFRWESSSPALQFHAPMTMTVEGGALITLRFQYAPVVPDAVTATLTIDAPGLTRMIVRGRGATLGYRVEHGAAACEGQPGSISLGHADGTAPVRQTVRIASTGTAPIRIAARLERLSPGVSLEPSLLDRTVRPGEVAELTAIYDPAEPVPLETTLVISTDSVMQRGERIPLCATASFPLVCARPSPLDLGMVPPGTSATGRIDVTNCGTEPLAVTAVALATDLQHAPTPGFTVTSSVPKTLPAGVSAPVMVSLLQPSMDASTAWVRIASSSPKTPELFVPVSAHLRRPCDLKVTPDPIALRAQIEPEREVRVENVGGEDCVIEQLALAPTTSAFRLTRTPALPVTVAPTSAVAFGVAYDGSTSTTRARAVLTLAGGTTREIDVIGDPSVPTECFLTARPAVLDFGLVRAGEEMVDRFEVTNHGRQTCRLLSGRLDANTDSRFGLSSGSFPVAIPGGQSLGIAVSYRSTGDSVARGRVELETNDEAHGIMSVGLIAGRQRCDDNCDCEAGETMTLWRFDEYGMASAIEHANGGEAFARSCDIERCPPGLVAVEVARRQFECMDAPPACLPDEGLRLDESGPIRRLACGPCDVVVHFGVLYDNLRVCADRPETACMPGQVPTLDLNDHQWRCQDTCNNGAYDRVNIDSFLVCVPC